MKRNKGFTLLEIVVVLIMVGIMATFAISMYGKYIEKAKSSEAIINAGHIRSMQIARKAETGSYISAENTEKINELLGLGILSKNFIYRVVGVTDDNFLILAHRVDDDIKSGQSPQETIVVAMDKNGMVQSPRSSGDITGGSTGSGGSSGGGSSGGGSSGGGSSGGGSSGGGSGGSGGGGTGNTGGGGSGGGGDDNEVGGIGGASLGANTGGGWSSLASPGGSGAVIDSGLQGAVDLLKNSTSSSYAYTLIEDKRISLGFADLGEGVGAAWFPLLNTIKVNSLYSSESLTSAIASLIVHEATHADYSYFTAAWATITLTRHPELTRAQLSLPADSVNQEYDCFCNQMLAWKELRTGIDANNDGWMRIYNQGESIMRANIKSTYARAGFDLPDY